MVAPPPLSGAGSGSGGRRRGVVGIGAGAAALGGRRRVLVLGASGNVGQASLHWIVQSDASGACEILAGARDPHALATPRGVRAVRAEMTSGPDEVEGAPPPEWMRGLDVLVIITPGNDERVPATLRTARQAAAAGVAQLIVVSVSTAELADSIFGKQFEEIERGVAAVAAASSSAVRFTIVRLPLFLENYYGFAQSVRDNDAIRCAVDPAARYSPIAVTDVGEALAAIATDTSGAQLGATLSLAGASHTFGEVASWLGEARGAAVRCERIGTDECRDALLGFGFQRWQADGVLELYDLISAGRYDFESAALEALLGHPPVSVQAWVAHAAPAFAAVASDRAEADSGRDAASSVASLSVEGGEGASDDDDEVAVADDDVPRPRAPTVAAQAAMEELWQRVVLLEEQGETMAAAGPGGEARGDQDRVRRGRSPPRHDAVTAWEVQKRLCEKSMPRDRRHAAVGVSQHPRERRVRKRRRPRGPDEPRRVPLDEARPAGRAPRAR